MDLVAASTVYQCLGEDKFHTRRQILDRRDSRLLQVSL